MEVEVKAEWKTARFLRGVSADAGDSMRTLDRALWQYSKVKG
jgi:hypothetical protein